MEHLKRNSSEQLIAMEAGGDNRRKPRLDGQLSLTFSGMDAKEIVIDTGMITDLCQDGIGASSERSLKPGMDLALFIECPDSEDYLCIPEARVAWVSGNRFGLSIRTMKTEDQVRLQQVFLSARRQPRRLS